MKFLTLIQWLVTLKFWQKYAFFLLIILIFFCLVSHSFLILRKFLIFFFDFILVFSVGWLVLLHLEWIPIILKLVVRFLQLVNELLLWLIGNIKSKEENGRQIWEQVNRINQRTEEEGHRKVKTIVEDLSKGSLLPEQLH